VTFDPERDRRRSIRLRGYDYASAGAYFVTLCTRERECLFGDVIDNAIMLNETGRLVADEWLRSATLRTEIDLDAWIVMPNHLHGIVVINDQPTVGAYGNTPPAGNRPRSPSRTLGAMVRGFKSATTARINIMRDAVGVPVWQRNYYEHIIRGDAELHRIRQYVVDNPRQWASDRENPSWVTGTDPTDLEPWERHT
jgi:REP element-mobilizing transposase RayT